MVEQARRGAGTESKAEEASCAGAQSERAKPTPAAVEAGPKPEFSVTAVGGAGKGEDDSVSPVLDVPHCDPDAAAASSDKDEPEPSRKD